MLWARNLNLCEPTSALHDHGVDLLRLFGGKAETKADSLSLPLHGIIPLQCIIE
jgi:hypothetical protein